MGGFGLTVLIHLLQYIMYKNNLIIAGSIALAIHAALVMAPAVTSEPEVVSRKGESSLKMHLIPSMASVASTKSVNRIREVIHKEEAKVTDNHNPLPKPETPKENRNKAEVNGELTRKFDVVSKALSSKAVSKAEDIGGFRDNLKIEEETYRAEYFEAEKQANVKSSIQEQDTTAMESKEVTADVKVKGIVEGAVINNVFKPFYPSNCKRLGHEGTTVLEVKILSNGKCGDIDVIRSAGCKSLDKAARQALKKADFIPAKRLGVSFTTTKKIAFNFKLEDEK